MINTLEIFGQYRGREISEGIAVKQRNEATVATSTDGQMVLTYTDEEGAGNLYISKLVGNQWARAEKVNKAISSKGWEPDEFISADGSTLYFTSNRPGGYGGMDIYVCTSLADGEWGKPINLGPVINSPFDEEAPFVYSDGNTIFFSSNRNKRDCMDVFSSSLRNDSVWTEPIMIGYPAKTAAEDTAGIVANPKVVSGTDSKNEVVCKENDVFLTTFIDQKKVPFTILKGKVTDADGNMLRHVKITVTDNETRKISGIFRLNYEGGNYLLPLPSGKNNNITYESDGYLFQSENVDFSGVTGNFKTHTAIKLPPVKSGSKIMLNNIFFDLNGAALDSASNVELNKLFLFLSMKPGMVVRLSYHIDNTKNGKYSVKLALEREQAVANYLIQRGIDADRLAAGSGRDKRSLQRERRGKVKRRKSQGIEIVEGLELKIIAMKK